LGFPMGKADWIARELEVDGTSAEGAGSSVLEHPAAVVAAAVVKAMSLRKRVIIHWTARCLSGFGQRPPVPEN
jgi:hypothetical protein